MRHFNMRNMCSLGLTLLLWALPSALQAAPRTATTSGLWTNDAIWGGTQPLAGDDVVISNGVAVTADVSTVTLNSLTNNGTLVFSGWNTVITSTTVTVTGTVTHLPNTDTNISDGWQPDNAVRIVCTNLTVASGGRIDANGKGFLGGFGLTNGFGPGAGSGGVVAHSGGGGSCGGKGGGRNGWPTSFSGPVYGAASVADWPGSGGGCDSANVSGGAGGGLIQIFASGTVTVQGTITANGIAGSGESGGGSGGGIHIVCDSLAGAGTLSANGGAASSWGGSGGGGRISLDYQSAAGWAGALQAGYGIPINNSANHDLGTVWVPDGKLPKNAGTTWYGRICNVTASSIPVFDLNGGYVRFEEAALQLTVVSNVSLRASALLEFPTNQTAPVAVNVGGDMILSNGTLSVSAMPTNGAPDYGAFVGVTGTVYISSNSFIYPYSHPTNGGSVLFRLGGLTVAAFGKLDADYKGFAGGRYLRPSSGNFTGWGYGGSAANGTCSGGAGFGGSGGDGAGGSPVGGVTYGSSNAPADPGSGAGCNNTAADSPNGGGLVRIDATGGRIRVDGTITANGQTCPSDRTGGAAGGGIFLTCSVLDGTGIIRAYGGNGAWYYGGGGGGGRIAVHFQWTNFAGFVAVSNGVKSTQGGNTAQDGELGTLVWFRLATPPLITNAPASNIDYFSATLNATLTSTGTEATTVSVYWGAVDGGTNKNLWAYTNTFDTTPPEDNTLSTNVAGLGSGTWYYYRFYATNANGEAWAPTFEAFRTVPGLPVISNAAAGATGITYAAAALNGLLVSTGTSFTTISAFWGPSDGGTNASAWANTNAFPGNRTTGLWSTNVTLPASNTTYYYTFCATNTDGDAWASPSLPFVAGAVWIVATDPNAAENGGDTGAFTVYRPSTATNSALTVNYVVSGTASNGMDYVALPGSVTLPPGASSATITVTPFMDAIPEGPEAVILSLSNGQYIVGTPGSDTVTIQNVVPAALNTWTGIANWTNFANWSDSLVPIDGQDVIVNGTTTLAMASAAIGTFNLTAGNKLTFSTTNAVLNAVTVNINGTITHNLNTATNPPWTLDNRVNIVCTNLTVAAGGAIDVSGKGYAGSAAASVTNGYGPGGGVVSGIRGGAGGYGGAGGAAQTLASAGGGPYGVAAAPDLPGSGGAGGQSGGGAGGGYVRLQVTSLVTVNGSIIANGVAGVEDSGGAGSGGGIYITGASIAGAGTFSANGGNSSAWGAAAGGGRIALVYDLAAQSSQNSVAAPTVQLSANPGTKSPNAVTPGRPGTLYFADNSFLSSLRFQSGQFTGVSNWTPASLTVTNKWLIFPDSFALGATNDITIGTGGILEISNANVTVGGSLNMTNGGLFYIYAATTNAPAPNYGTLISLTRDMDVATNCTIFVNSHPTNGGSALFRMRSLTVATGGKFDADGKGFRSSLGPGRGTAGAGAGYGGNGGGTVWPAPTAGGVTYGSSNAPVDPGSGGGLIVNPVWGGGLVRIEAERDVLLNGSLSANGQSDTTDRSGGGSGGGIYVRCGRQFLGAGSLSANGGATPQHSGGGGGGGRIAVWSVYPSFTGTATASGGTGFDGNGQPGTVIIGRLIPPGTIFIVH